MNGRGGVGKFFLLLFASLVILLQIRSLIQSRRFARSVGKLQDSLTGVRYEETQESSPDDGDWLVWAFRMEPKTLNQISTESDIYSRWITVPYIFEPLLFYDYDSFEMKPHLAESYEIADDGLSITFRLRDDVHFSDGVPVTANDVIFTYETIIDPNIDSADIANLFIDVAEAVKVDERTVRFVMKQPYFKALENLSFWDIGILPKHIYEYKDAKQFNNRVSNPVGSGPFVFEKWQTGREIVLRRNENYWGPKPKLKKIVFRIITNAIAAVQALRAHEVDMIIPEPDQFAELAADPQFTKEFTCLSMWMPGAPFYYIGWNQDKVFFKDRRVRLAMTHIIDRKKIVRELLKGYGRVVTGPFYIEGPQYDKNIKPWPYDPAEARRLLDEAGWVDTDGDGIRDKDDVAFRFEFMYSSDKVQYQRIAKLLKSEAAKVGIVVVPEPMEWSVIMTRIVDRDFEAMVMGWGGDILEDPYQLWHSSQIGNRGANYVGFRNAQADALIEQGRRTLDADKRNALYHQLHRILHQEQPYTFLFSRPVMRPVDKRFENVKIYKLGPKYWQWYVPKDRQRYK